MCWLALRASKNEERRRRGRVSGAASNLLSLEAVTPAARARTRRGLPLTRASTSLTLNPRVQTRDGEPNVCVSLGSQALYPPVLGTRAARGNPVVVASQSSSREVE